MDKKKKTFGIGQRIAISYSGWCTSVVFFIDSNGVELQLNKKKALFNWINDVHCFPR